MLSIVLGLLYGRRRCYDNSITKMKNRLTLCVCVCVNLHLFFDEMLPQRWCSYINEYSLIWLTCILCLWVHWKNICFFIHLILILCCHSLYVMYVSMYVCNVCLFVWLVFFVLGCVLYFPVHFLVLYMYVYIQLLLTIFIDCWRFISLAFYIIYLFYIIIICFSVHFHFKM